MRTPLLAAVTALVLLPGCGSTDRTTAPLEMGFCRSASALDGYSADPAEVRTHAGELRAVFDELDALASVDVPVYAQSAISDLDRILGHVENGYDSLIEAEADQWTAAHRTLANVVQSTCGDLPTFLEVAVAVPPTTAAPAVFSAWWPDLPLYTLCVDLSGTWQDQPVAGDEAVQTAQVDGALGMRGLEMAAPGAACEATLTGRFTGVAKSAQYRHTEDGKVTFEGELWVGAHIEGTLELAAAGRDPITATPVIDDEPSQTEWTFGDELPTEPIDALDHVRMWLADGLEKLGLAGP
jgi:hypothetical protein